jgi:hypothetical protein
MVQQLLGQPLHPLLDIHRLIIEKSPLPVKKLEIFNVPRLNITATVRNDRQNTGLANDGGHMPG